MQCNNNAKRYKDMKDAHNMYRASKYDYHLLKRRRKSKHVQSPRPEQTSNTT